MRIFFAALAAMIGLSLLSQASAAPRRVVVVPPETRVERAEATHIVGDISPAKKEIDIPDNGILKTINVGLTAMDSEICQVQLSKVDSTGFTTILAELNYLDDDSTSIVSGHKENLSLGPGVRINSVDKVRLLVNAASAILGRGCGASVIYFFEILP